MMLEMLWQPDAGRLTIQSKLAKGERLTFRFTAWVGRSTGWICWLRPIASKRKHPRKPLHHEFLGNALMKQESYKQSDSKNFLIKR
jgi:hypothetical protein